MPSSKNRMDILAGRPRRLRGVVQSGRRAWRPSTTPPETRVPGGWNPNTPDAVDYPGGKHEFISLFRLAAAPPAQN